MATSYTKNHLGKTLDDGITASDIISYFAEEREESLTLEFKSYYAGKDKPNFDGVLRTIAAFLNSEGGLLIYGAPIEIESKPGDKYKRAKGAPTPIPISFTTKDSLVNRISDNISYMPIGIRVEPILMGSGTYVYLIEVQESLNKPHQYGKQYPIRLDGQSIGAPHYLVEALFNQIRRPELEGYLRVTSYKLDFNPGGYYNTISIRFIATVFNVTKTINDTDVYMQLVANSGIFQPGPDTSYKLGLKGKSISVHNTGLIITDAVPVRHIFDFKIDTNAFDEIDGVLEVRLIFGGRNSSTRISFYHIKRLPPLRHLSPNEQTKIYDQEKDLKFFLNVVVQPLINWTGIANSFAMVSSETSPISDFR